ncbi:hypothetical protein H6503_00805 [Candidatus Woesearchaeota archaeon]|nr:hypothetical protein [Candidatus Woesearchaeota archaeon]
MAGFDPNLDVQKFEEIVEFDGSNIKVGVYSYNEGQPKLQLSRERVNAEGQTSFAKLGRMTKDEAEKVIPVMQKAIESM